MVQAFQMHDSDDRFVPPRLRGLSLVGFGMGGIGKIKQVTEDIENISRRLTDEINEITTKKGEIDRIAQLIKAIDTSPQAVKQSWFVRSLWEKIYKTGKTNYRNDFNVLRSLEAWRKTCEDLEKRISHLEDDVKNAPMEKHTVHNIMERILKVNYTLGGQLIGVQDKLQMEKKVEEA